LDSGVAVQHAANADRRMQDRSTAFSSHQHGLNSGLHVIVGMS